MIRLKPNPRNTRRGKAMRLHNLDIWNTLATKKKINRVTKRIFYDYCKRLKKIIRKSTRYPLSPITQKIKMLLKKKTVGALRYFGRNLPRLPLKLYHRGRKKREQTATGAQRKQWKRIALFLTGCRRTKKKQLRSLIKKGKLVSKIIGQRDGTIFQGRKNSLLKPIKKGYTHPTFIERRLDALLVHGHLVKTVFQARQFILHGKAMVNGKREVRTNFIVPNFVPVTLSISYRLKRKKELLKMVRKGNLTTYVNTTAFYVDLYTNVNLVLAGF